MTETTPSGFSAVNIPTYNAIITMKVIGNINCCASVWLSTAAPIAANIDEKRK